MSDLRVLAVPFYFPRDRGNGRHSGWHGYKASLACLALVLGQGCQVDPASLPVEPPPSRLAARVDRLLDDPSQLPAVALAVAVTTTAPPAAVADAGTLAAPDVDATEAAQDTGGTGPAAPTADTAGAVAAAAPQAGPAADAKATAGAKPAADGKPAAEAKPAIDKSAATDRKAEAERKVEAERAATDRRAETERKAEAERAAKAAAAEPPPPPGADATDLYYSGKRKLDAGDLRGAVADFKASQAVRFSLRTLTMLGRAYFDLGEFGPAAKALQQAGDHDDAMLLLAQLYQQQGKTAQARKVYERFLKVHADHAKAAWVKRMLDAL